MDVVTDNFEDCIPLVERAVEEADFISFDLEMTGLFENYVREHWLDAVQSRYEKVRHSASNFLCLQFGLSSFKWDEEAKTYVAKVFNFYVFPGPVREINLDRRFLGQSSSIQFLISHGFDFTKCFREGITYITNDEEKRLRERKRLPPRTAPASREPAAAATISSGDGGGSDSSSSSSSSNNNNNNSTSSSSSSSSGNSSSSSTSTSATSGNKDVELDDAAREWADKVKKDVAEWVKDTSTSKPVVLTLPACNGFLRRVTYQELAKVYGDSLTLDSVDCGKGRWMKSITVTKMSVEEKEAHEAAALAEKEKYCLDQVGFRRIIDMLVHSNKAIVGHNMWLDLAHTYAHFLGALSGTIEEFKVQVQEAFPCIYDTKYMATVSSDVSQTWPSTSLEDALKAVQSWPEKLKVPITFAEGFDAYATDSSRYHEAGYDSYCTGVVFASLSHRLKRRTVVREKRGLEEGEVVMAGDDKENNDEKQNGEHDDDDDDTTAIESVIPSFVSDGSLDRFRNRIAIMRSDLLCINLAGPDDKPNRDHVFHISQFKPEWSTTDLIAAFTSRSLHPPIIKWIDDISAFAIIRDNTHDEVMDAMLANDGEFEFADHATYSVMKLSSGAAPCGAPARAAVDPKKRRHSTIARMSTLPAAGTTTTPTEATGGDGTGETSKKRTKRSE